MTLAMEAERRLGDFKPQELANTAWAFATLRHADNYNALISASEKGKQPEPWRCLRQCS